MPPIQKEYGEDRPIIVHCFSNGGGFVYAEHLREWEAGRTTTLDPSRIAGLVYDSAPAYLHTQAGARAVTESLPPGLLRTVLYYAFLGGMHVWNAVAGDRGATGFWHVVTTAPALGPELYVYSQDDAITSAPELRELVQTRGAAGVPVSSLVLASSPHVTHLRTAPATYAATVGAWARGLRSPGDAAFAPAACQEVLAGAAEDGMDVAPVAGDPRHALVSPSGKSGR